jgi:hypothetical protein
VQPIGDAFYLFDGMYEQTPALAKQVISGQRYTFMRSGYLSGYRIDVVAGNTYLVYTVKDPLGIAQKTLINEFVATESGIVVESIVPIFITTGFTIDLLYVTTEPNPTPATFQGDWNYATPNNSSPPIGGQIVQANTSSSVISISKLDNAAGDRSAELSNLSIGDIIDGAGVRWTIQATPSDQGLHYNISVSPSIQGSPDGVSTFVFEITIATPITVSSAPDYWLSNPNIQGLLGVDIPYEDIVPDDNAYGTDFLVQYAEVPTDWDFVAYSGSAAGGSGTGHIEKKELGTFSSLVAQNPTGLGVAGIIKITFGAGGDTDNGEFTVAPTGVITTNKGGIQYNLDLVTRIGRIGAAQTSEIMGRLMYAEDGVELNATQVGTSFSVLVDDPDTIWREEFNLTLRPATGSVLWFEIARNNGSSDSGGLLSYAFSGDLSSWEPTPTASLTFGRWQTA